MSTSLPATGYSYVRFSTPDQMKGDSLRRQVQATADWCQKNGVTLDMSLKLQDLGVSAHKGKHRTGDKHCLAQFVKLVNQGRIAKGSFLIIENLDRLSREDERTALRLWMDLLDSGINIVQLHPETVFRHEKSDMMDIMRAIIELSRGHSESAMKSKRNGSKWAEKRRLAKEGKPQASSKRFQGREKFMTRQFPSWVREVDGQLQLDPDRAATVRRIYALAADGHGAGLIVQTLVREKRVAMGTSGQWSKHYVSMILNDRRALGEFQPRMADGTEAGEVLKGYYPACVTELEWQKARSAIGPKRRPMGRVGEHINIFSGLLKNARDGDSYYCQTRMPQGKRHRVLISRRAVENETPCYSFPFDVFERAVLSLFKEIKPEEVLGTAPGQDAVILLSGELAHVQAQQAALATELLKGDVSALAKAARTLDAREKELKEQLAIAKAKVANPAAEMWGEAMSLVDVLDGAADPRDVRLKLRSLLRGLVSQIQILAVGRGRDRLAAVQVYFIDDGHRDYLILSRPPMGGSNGFNRPGGWWARSLADAAALGDLDLRRPAHVKAMEKVLLELDLARLTGR
jgi:DNA invertase Pin-like site-specific DNA recombinase